MTTTPMTPEELLRWARIAAEAAGYNPLRDVMLLPGREDGHLKIISIGNCEMEQICFGDGNIGWQSGGDSYESLAKALAEMLSEAVHDTVSGVLIDAGLKWEGEG